MAAFGELYEIFRPQIYLVCVLRLGDHHLAEDAVQDVFARARNSLDGFDGVRPFIHWLTTIALNRSADIWRANQRFIPIGLASEIEPLFDARDDTWAAVSNNDDRTRISRAASKLPTKTQRVFLQHDYDGLSYSEIASEDGTTIESARALVFKARAKMRSTLEALSV